MGKLARSSALIGLAAPFIFLVTRVSAQAAAPSATASFPPLPTAAPAPAAAAPPPPPPPPPVPPQSPDRGFKMPDISVRIDPINFLLEGRLGLELETELYEFLSLEVVPVFVTTQSPPTLNYSTYEKSSLRQESNGWGPISGAAIDLGIWLAGKPFKGTVLRAGFTNYAYTYRTTAPANDSVSHTSRQFFAMLGSHSRWSAFTIAYGVGLGYELNQQNRCFDPLGNPTSSCPKDQMLIKLNQPGTAVADLTNYLYPFEFLARLSLGVVF